MASKLLGKRRRARSQCSFDKISFEIAMPDKAEKTQMRSRNCADKPGPGIRIQSLFWLSIFFASVMLTPSVLAQQKDERVALVIGNAKYPDA
jgi:hypothetical protein